MKKEYMAPEAEIEEFVIEYNIFCRLSDEDGNESGNEDIGDF